MLSNIRMNPDMSIPMININQLHQEREERINRKKNTYESILKRCHHRIITSSKNDSTCFCFFVVPNYIYGVPLYNMKTCVIYIISCLSNNGFDVKYTHPNLIYISWFNKKNPKNFNTKTASIQPQKHYKTIEDYKPSGNFIYDDSSVNLLKNKAFSLLE